jgi:8-oxo-dGTP pyrophosphatase MutT (NUDIX family)
VTHFIALLHLVAAAVWRQRWHEEMTWVIVDWDAAMARMDRYVQVEAILLERYGLLLGMPADVAFVTVLCRGDHREAVV